MSPISGNVGTGPSQFDTDNPPADKTPLGVTLGAEFEFLLLRNTYPELYTSTGHGYNDITLGLTQVSVALYQPLKAKCFICGQSHTFKLPLNHDNTGLHQDKGKWSIVLDSTVKLTNREIDALGDNNKYVKGYAVELVTRILSTDKNLQTTHTADGHTHEITYQEEIAAVLTRLRKYFDPLRKNTSQLGAFTLLTNEHAGFHVHIGNGNFGFPLRTVKNLLSTYIANEHAIDQMHSMARICWSTLPLHEQYQPCRRGDDTFCVVPSGIWNKPLSAQHFKDAYIRRTKAALPSLQQPPSRGVTPYPDSHLSDPKMREAALDYSARSHIELVRNAPVLSDLQDMVHRGHWSAVNLENLVEFGEESHEKMTVEFRQHVSTLDSGEVLAYINFLVSLVQHSHKTEAIPFDSFINDSLSSFRPTRSLLQTIECAPETLSFYDHKLDVQQTHNHFALDTFAQNQNTLIILGESDVRHDLLQANMRYNYNRTRPNNVRQHIGRKFLEGGYGQFPNHHPALQNIPRDIREKLTTGYINPASQLPAAKQWRRPSSMKSSHIDGGAVTAANTPTSATSQTSAEMVGYKLSDEKFAFTVRPLTSAQTPRNPPFLAHSDPDRPKRKLAWPIPAHKRKVRFAGAEESSSESSPEPLAVTLQPVKAFWPERVVEVEAEVHAAVDSEEQFLKCTSTTMSLKRKAVDIAVDASKKPKSNSSITSFFGQPKSSPTAASSQGNDAPDTTLTKFDKAAWLAKLTPEQHKLLQLEIDTLDPTWLGALASELTTPSFLDLKRFLAREAAAGAQVFPPPADIYSWSRSTPLTSIKAVILGQDPYHNNNQAHGLCFSVRPPTPAPQSLKNMYIALKRDYPSFTPPPNNSGLLTPWAESGVLLLNTCLTVRAHEANSHAKKGWEKFTQKVIDTVVAKRTKGVVFLAWGSPAQARCKGITGARHLVLKSVHPSPLSAHKGFFECGHFRKANEWLAERYGPEGAIEWGLGGSKAVTGAAAVGVKAAETAAATKETAAVEGAAQVAEKGEIKAPVEPEAAAETKAPVELEDAAETKTPEQPETTAADHPVETAQEEKVPEELEAEFDEPVELDDK